MSIFINLKKSFKEIKLKNCITALAGSAILAFGLYNVHSFAGVTEGGVLGATLLFHHWFDISPAVSGLILNAICYIFGWHVLGTKFIIYSSISGIGFSLFYSIFESFPPIYPNIAEHQVVAAVIGALFVGIGVGIGVKSGAASGGDDALAMAISYITGWHIQWIYLSSDIIVLILSLSYIAPKNIAYSLLTVILSGQIIGLIQKINFKNMRNNWK